MAIITNRTAFFLACSLSLAACGAEHGGDPSPGAADGDRQSPTAATAQDRGISGLDAYRQVCARCHESGADNAPVTGNPADWEGRSHLWQAVLMEHANAGFFEMPAKGGDEALSKGTIDAATEYMLEVTFPDRPRD